MNALELMKKDCDFFVGIDSDGCVFDTMELKHKECFIPCFIEAFELQTISRYAREVWEFVNLYSAWRGLNRFKAVVKTFDLLEQRKEVRESGFKIKDYSLLKNWTEHETELSNNSLKCRLAATKDDMMEKCLFWSVMTNERIESMVHGIKPFRYVDEVLLKLQGKTDVIVVSSANSEALKTEWGENGLTKSVKVLADQKMGTKQQCLQTAAAKGYSGSKMLMIGDSPWDQEAAEKSGTLFYPIIPGEELESWKRLYEEGIEKFLLCEFEGRYQEELKQEFNSNLSTVLPWKY